MSNPLRSIPSVTELLDSPPLRSMVDKASRNVVVSGVRSFLDRLRNDVQHAAADFKLPSPGELAEKIAEWIQQDERFPLRPVINATGILLHTGLGRAPLAEEAVRAVDEAARGYCSLEMDLEHGERSDRNEAVRRTLREVTGAEDAVVVNNNAAATVLALAALARDREVVVSRGQLIEIGGSYRLPEVMSASGARLREVGTTNKTRIGDYAAAIGEQTAALMRVHTSNYRIVGFTEETGLTELVALARQRSLPLIDDLGSGALVDLRPFGLREEPSISASIAAGADLVLCSGDKLLGGPQAGIMVGRRDLLAKITQHPLMRAFRVDKLTLAALAATLRLYRDPELAARRVPVLALLGTDIENLKNRATRMAPQLAATPAVATAEPVAGEAYLGGGSVPTQAIPTWCVAITPRHGSVDDLAARLRRGEPSVVGRIQEGKFLLDLRSVFPAQDMLLIDTFAGLEPAPKVSDTPEREGNA